MRDPQHPNRWLLLLPDGAFEVVYGDGRVQYVLIEIDMGTLTLERFRRKACAFEQFLARGRFERYFHREDFQLAVLTPVRKRLEHVWRVVRDEVRDAYLFASSETLDPDRFPSTKWVSASNGLTGLLYADASPKKRAA